MHKLNKLLHTHPRQENQKNLDINHVIVDRKDRDMVVKYFENNPKEFEKMYEYSDLVEYKPILIKSDIPTNIVHFTKMDIKLNLLCFYPNLINCTSTGQNYNIILINEKGKIEANSLLWNPDLQKVEKQMGFNCTRNKLVEYTSYPTNATKTLEHYQIQFLIDFYRNNNRMAEIVIIDKSNNIQIIK